MGAAPSAIANIYNIENQALINAISIDKHENTIKCATLKQGFLDSVNIFMIIHLNNKSVSQIYTLLDLSQSIVNYCKGNWGHSMFIHLVLE